MLYLSGLAIIFVVLGHVSGPPTSVFSFDQWFPFYSFHMPLFLFISGYFYKTANDHQTGRFILKKAKKLLIPYYAVNLFFLLLQTLLRLFGFYLGETFSLFNWLVQPWVQLQPKTLAIASWYLICFFISIVIYVLLRRLFLLMFKNQMWMDLILLIFLLILGMAAIWFYNHFQPKEVIVVYLRSVVSLFFIQLGFFYKNYLEKHDRLKNLPYFLLLFILRFLMILLAIHSGASQTFGLWGLDQFDDAMVSFYAAGILGIALWLRIAAILATLPKKLNLLLLIGNETKNIMFFHLFGFFILNVLLYFSSFVTGFFGLEKEKFFTHIYYTTSNIGQMALIYLAFGIGISLAIAVFLNKIKGIFQKMMQERRSKRQCGSDCP